MEEPHTESEVKEVNQTRKNLPLPRFFARIVDTIIGTILIAILGIVFFIGTGVELTFLDNTPLYTIVFFVTLLIIESLFLAIFGNTFGRWFFRVKIQKDHGRISFSNAFHRSVLVFVCGLVFGVPLLCLFGMAHSYERIRKKGITYWDEVCGFTVECEKLNWWRTLVMVLISLLILWAYYLGQQQ